MAEWDALRHGGNAATARLEDNWGVREYQHMLAGLGYYGGQVDELSGALTDAAVRNFQSDHGLAADGIVGDQTWLALIDAYLGLDALALPEDQLLPNCAGEHLKWLGSGEKDPVRNTEDAWRPNRRTEVVFVKASAVPFKAPPPVTFDLPAPGAVNAGWCAGSTGDPVVVLSRTAPQPATIFVQPVDSSTFVVKGKLVFEDGTPATGVQYVLTASDGEYMDGERPAGPGRGRPLPGTIGSPRSPAQGAQGPTDGSFAYPDQPKHPGVFTLTVLGALNVRLASAPPNSATTPTQCLRLDGSQDFNLVVAKADGVDPRRKLTATVFDRAFAVRANTAVSVEFPDGSTGSATTDAGGQFALVMSDAFPTAKLRYAASDAPGDEILFRDYFIDAGDIATDDGVSRRLHNLGMLVDSLPAAVMLFQAFADLPATGTVDDATRLKLDRVYRGEAPLALAPPARASGAVTPLLGDGPPETNPRFGGDDGNPSGNPFGAL